MILNKETYEKYKYDANSISKFSTKVLIVQCDNCKNIFEKESNKIFMARKNSSSEFDVCKEKKCIVSKREMTMEKKYGNKYALNNVFLKEKRKTTCIKNDTYKNAQEKTKATNLKKYGCENVFQTEWCKEKIYQSHIKNHVGMGFASPEIKEKIKKSIKTKYNTENFQSTDEFKNKTKNTNNKKYGVDWYMQSSNFKKKTEETLTHKYGVKNYNQTSEFFDKIRKKRFDNFYDKITNNIRISSVYIPLFGRDDYNGVDNKYLFHCKKCNQNFHDTFDDGNFPVCHHCYPPLINRSSLEVEIYEFIKSITNGTIHQNDKFILENKYELDLYIPEKNIAIELNGNYWHSEVAGEKNRLYHVSKTQECESKNIHLIQIFEDEWINKKSIIQEKLKVICNVASDYIHARKCEIKSLSKLECDAFLNNYHIQGTCISTTQLGLFFENKLVSAMTFGPSRFEKNTHELIRYASSTRINGGFNKLLNFYKNNKFNETIVSYADRRWTNIYKNVYISNGFLLEKITPPNYYYIQKTNYLNRINRMNYQKHSLEKKLQTFDANLSEWDNMQLNNFDRIWDCGNLKYKL